MELDRRLRPPVFFDRNRGIEAHLDSGGTYFHNSNDLDEGFRRTAYPPEYIYVLRFSPQKLDGKFHKLKVTFSGPEKRSMQAREGYYVLKPGSDK
jgi:hypothetical protein